MILSSVVLFSLVGCNSSAEQKYSDVEALLDPQAGEIILPLEKYAMTPSEEKDVAHANALLQDECLSESGREFPRAKQNWELAPTLPDRRYGLWSESDAQANGYELPESSEAAELTAAEEALGDDWWQAYEACRSELELLPVMGINTSVTPSPVDIGMGESFDSLVASANLREVRQEWLECVQNEGLTLDENSVLLVPAIPPAGEEQIRVATIDVECKQSYNSVQRLANIEAREQSAFIDDRESDLLEYRTQVDDVLNKAREVLATRAT